MLPLPARNRNALQRQRIFSSDIGAHHVAGEIFPSFGVSLAHPHRVGPRYTS
ncbi:MAG: hypothetical protein ACXW2A_08990 [Burkholderiales bacterium]